jgi:stress-induced morphogen
MLSNFLRRCVTSAISQSASQPNWTTAASLRVRLLATDTPAVAPNEQNLIDQLRVKFPKATDIAVADVSGGCGAMFEVFVEAPDFKGMRVVKQHQMVNQALKSEIKEMHGLRISTAVPPENS